MTGTLPVTTQAGTTLPRAGSVAGPASGILAGVLAFVASPPQAPANLAGPALRAWVEEQSAQLRTFGVLMALTSLALVMFVGYLRQVIKAHDPSRGYLADVAFGSGLVCAVWLLFSGTATSLVAYDLPALTDEMVLQLHSLGRLGDMLGSSALVFKAALLVSVSAAALSGRFLPAWLSWSGLVLGALTMLGIVGAFVDGVVSQTLFYIGLFAFALWPLPVGISLGLNAVRARRRGGLS